MPRAIRGPGGKVHIVPDDATDSEIAGILSQDPPPPSAGPDWSVAPTLGGMAGGIGGLLLGGPLGALAGATLGGGLGKAAEMSQVPAEAPINAGDAVLRLLGAATQQGAMEVPGSLAGALAPWASRRLMQSALKPSNALLQEGANLGIRTKGDVAEAVLREPGVLPTAGTRGVAGVRSQIDEINASIQDLLQQSGRRGTPIDLAEAARPINEQAQRALMQANPEADLVTVNRLADEFQRHPLGRRRFLAPESGPAQPNQWVPVEDAQRLKTGTYQQVYGRRGELGSVPVDTGRALARGLKDEIATAIPEISAKNMRESELLFIEKALQEAVNRTGNRDPIGFANASPTTRRFWLALADSSPVIKAALARAVRGPLRAGLQMAPSLMRGASVGAAIDAHEVP